MRKLRLMAVILGGLTLFAPLLAYLALPWIASTALRTAVERIGGSVSDCELSQVGWISLVSSDCKLRLPIANRMASVQIKNATMFWAQGSPFPILELEALEIIAGPESEAQRESLDTDRNNAPTFPPFGALFISRVSIKTGTLTVEDTLRLRYSIEASRNDAESIAFIAAIESLAYAPFVESFSANISGSVTNYNETPQISFTPSSDRPLRFGIGDCWLTVAGVATQQPLELLITTPRPLSDRRVIDLVLRSPNLECPAASFSANAVSLLTLATNPSDQYEAVFKIERLKLRTSSGQLPFKDLSITVDANPKALKAEISSSQGEGIAASGSVTYSMGEAIGSFKGSLGPLQFSQEQPLATFVTMDGTPTVSGGRLQLKGTGSWGQKSELRLELSAIGLAGSVKDLPFSGGLLELSLGYLQGWYTTKPAKIAVALLDIGIPIRDTSLAVSVKKSAGNPSEIRVENLSSSLLGGVLQVDNVEFVKSNATSFLVKVEKLDLSQVLGLSGEQIQGTGLLSGSIPVRLLDGAIHVSEGKLEAVPPGGSLRYKPSAGTRASANQNQNLELALNALEQFAYTNMEVLLQYAPTGDLVSVISLLGRNPNLFNGREIQFKVTVEQNLLSLLKSIQVARKPI